MTRSFHDHRPTASIDVLRRRAKLLQNIRQFFDSRDFVEVETPLLSHDTVLDRHLHPISVCKSEVTGNGHDQQRLWLQTSPEFGMKRLLANGAEAIYQIGKAFRQGESGRHHNPEFTMLEWYRVGDGLAEGMQLLSDLVVEILQSSPADKLTYREAFVRYANLDPFTASLEELAHACVRDSGAKPGNADRDTILNQLLALQVEPHLGHECPVLVYNYPASQSALAKVSETDDGVMVAERFEIYVRGVELANGYHELCDANELRQRNSKVSAQRSADGSQALPTNSYLLEAMEEGLPACSGTALGVDRLMMLLEDTDQIGDVIAFTLDRA